MRSATRKKIGKNPAYLAFIRTLPCEVCGAYPVEAAHVGAGPRGFSAKCPDNETIPLCARHHRTGKDAHHVLGRNFWSHHGIDRCKTIQQLNEAFEVFRDLKPFLA